MIISQNLNFSHKSVVLNRNYLKKSKNNITTIQNQSSMQKICKSQYIELPSREENNSQKKKYITNHKIIRRYKNNESTKLYGSQQFSHAKNTNRSLILLNNQENIYQNRKKVVKSRNNINKRQLFLYKRHQGSVDVQGDVQVRNSKKLNELLRYKVYVKENKQQQICLNLQDQIKKRFYQNLNEELNQQLGRQKSSTIQYQQIKNYYQAKYNKKKYIK